MIALRAGRGWGKSYFALRRLIARCLSFDKSLYGDSVMPTSYLIMKTASSVDQIHGRALDNLIETTDLKYAVKRVVGSSSGKTVFWQGDKPPLKLVGLGAGLSGETLRGNSFLDVCYDEASLLPMTKLHDEIIGPRLDYAESSELAIFTPKGRASEMYRWCQQATEFHFSSYDNPHRPRQQLDDLRSSLSPKKFQQEIMATWEDFDGKVLASYDGETVPESAFNNYVVAVDPGAVNPAVVVLGVSMEGLQVVAAWSNTTGDPVTSSAVGQRIVSMCQGRHVTMLYVPDDRPDLVGELRHSTGFPTTKLCRNHAKVKPAARANILDMLFYTHSLTVADTADRWQTGTSLADELTSLHRSENAYGVMTELFAPGQTQHRYDALGYAVSGLLIQAPRLAAKLLKYSPVTD